MATQHLTFSWNKLLKIWGILIICPLRTLFTLKPATPSISISISVSANQMVNLETWRHAGDHSDYYNGFPSRGGHYGGHKAREAVGCLFGAKYYVEFDGDFVVGLEIGLILYCVMAILLIGTRQGLWAGGCRTNEWPCGGLEDSETLLKYNNRNVTQGGVWVNLTWIWYLYLYHGTYIIFIARTIYAKIYNESNMPGENCGTELGYMIVELDLLIKIKKGTQEYSEGLYDTLWDFFIGVAPRPIGHA